MKFWRSLCFVVVSAVSTGLFAYEEQLAVNGGFESSKKSEGWYVPAKWRVEDGIGRKGTRALVWENDDPKIFTFPKQNVTIGPGSRYVFGGWVKTEAGKPKPQVCLGWCDATNKWISCVYATAVTDNERPRHVAKVGEKLRWGGSCAKDKNGQKCAKKG